jgi:hypothetical protein
LECGSVNAPTHPDALFRARHVGASEVAALFDASPWLTRFELFHRKAGTIATPEFNAVVDGTPENERVYFGVKLEPLVIEAACERWGYAVEPLPAPIGNGNGLGGHPDCIAICPERGRGILEVKTADWLVAKKWGDEPPLHYMLQAQTYAGLTGSAWADVIVLVGGNELRRFQYEFRPTLFAEIERRVAEFWQSVADGVAPPVDPARDGRTLVEVLGEPTDEVADLRDDLDAEQLAMEFAAGKALRDQGEAQMEAAKVQLIERIGTAGRALLPSFKIGCAMTKGSPDREARPGKIIKGRRGYRRFDLKEIA